MNQAIGRTLLSEGIPQIRPSYFNYKHFSYWNIRMETFIKSYDVKVWRVIKLGDLSLVPTNKDRKN